MKVLRVHAGFIAAAMVLSACGGSEPPAAPAPKAAPTEAAPAAPDNAAQPKAANAHQRIGDSLNILLTTKPPVLGSYHLEMSGSGPEWDSQSSSVKSQSFAVKAAVQDDNIHLHKTTTAADAAPETFDGYAIKGGMANTEGGGQEFEMAEGSLKPSYGVALAWAFLPLEVVGPVAIGGAGAQAQGQEAIDGRAADKFDINSDNAPAGVMGMLGGGMEKLRGTVWVDAQTGALLKLVADYDLIVKKPGGDEVAGKGPRHVELLVTGVGKTTVALPK